MLRETDATDLSTGVLIGTSAMMGDYALICLGAVFGAWILLCRTKTASRIDAAQLLFRSFVISLLFTLPVAIVLKDQAAKYGIPLDVMLPSLAGLMAISADAILGIIDKGTSVISGLIAARFQK